MSSMMRDMAEYFGGCCDGCEHYGRKEYEEQTKCTKCRSDMMGYYTEHFGSMYLDREDESTK